MDPFAIPHTIPRAHDPVDPTLFGALRFIYEFLLWS